MRISDWSSDVCSSDLYPNTDWYEILTRDWAPQQQHNLSVRGGSDRIKYYGMVGFLDQRTMWVESGGAYKRYNLQSNIDAKISDNLNLRFDISGRSEEHTSELQSLMRISYAVFCLKKKKIKL